MFKCSCGWEPKLIGQGHCSKHHTTYRVLNEDQPLCYKCRQEKFIKKLPELAELIRKS